MYFGIFKNAEEASDVTKITFEIKEHIVSDTTSEILFRIEDNGKRIPEKTIEDIQQ